MENFQKCLEIIKKYEDLKDQMKKARLELNQALTEIGVGSYFQDPESKIVVKVVEPTGTFIEFHKISYERTSKPTEKRGSLSKKEATEQGFEL